jgi:hypothetical protein
MQSNLNNNLNNYISTHGLDINELILLMEDIINMEQSAMSANRLLNNETALLRNEVRVLNAKILLRIFRMNKLGL